MHNDVTDLTRFYATPLGQVTRRLLSRRIRSRWPTVKGQTLVGLGFATPFIGAFRSEARRIMALMPAGQGALVWPPAGRTLSALVEERHLPLPDNSVDLLLAVHCLEASESARPLLREIWRVLAAEGRVILIVPNRRGVWARLDTTPFGQGTPYSRGQLETLLKDALLEPIDWSGALHIPPLGKRMLLKSAATIEKAGNRLAPGFSGVIIVEARKELAAPIGKAAVARARLEVVTVPR